MSIAEGGSFDALLYRHHTYYFDVFGYRRAATDGVN